MTHKISINGHEDVAKLMNFYGLKKTMFESGEVVTFSVHTATDTDYKVTSSLARISCENYVPGGISTYSFIMPDEDVEIDVSSYGSMMNPYMNGAPEPSMGMMTMCMMGMNGPVNADSNTGLASCQWEGKPEFCPECGASTKTFSKFCGECGAKLLPKE